MNVLVDTSAWSLLLRRASSTPGPVAAELTRLIRRNRAAIIGAIRQEVLSGICGARQFDDLRLRLRPFPDLAMETGDYEMGADYSNRCRARGIQGSPTDFLICATAARRRLAILSADDDFARYARFVPIRLHRYS
ncbi:MAG: PIN domain-containing protein [Gemmatimonadaceae bacterium]